MDGAPGVDRPLDGSTVAQVVYNSLDRLATQQNDCLFRAPFIFE
jgi:hypothetical protein